MSPSTSPMAGPANGKYGLLITPVSADRAPPGLGPLDPDTSTFCGRLDAVVPQSELRVWKKAFGTFAWDEVASEDRILVLIAIPSVRSNVSDQENDDLTLRLQRAWWALLLVGPTFPIEGNSWIVTGALGDSGAPMSVQTHYRLPYIMPPYYRTLQIFTDAMALSLPGVWGNADPWFDRWKEFYALLEPFARNGGVPSLLNHSIEAFRLALELQEIEYRIPTLVRAAECILALPRGKKGGQIEFAARGEKIALSLAGHWFVGGADIGQRLQQLYQLRNECVHGKIPFEELKKRGGGPDDAARLEYLAEELARQSLVAILRTPAKYHLFASRATIEKAWNSGYMPP